jgi:hypothetical protein
VHRAHRLHPKPRFVLCWPGGDQLRTVCRFCQKAGLEVNGELRDRRKIGGQVPVTNKWWGLSNSSGLDRLLYGGVRSFSGATHANE